MISLLKFVSRQAILSVWFHDLVQTGQSLTQLLEWATLARNSPSGSGIASLIGHQAALITRLTTVFPSVPLLSFSHSLLGSTFSHSYVISVIQKRKVSRLRVGSEFTLGKSFISSSTNLQHLANEIITHSFFNHDIQPNVPHFEPTFEFTFELTCGSCINIKY